MRAFKGLSIAAFAPLLCAFATPAFAQDQAECITIAQAEAGTSLVWIQLDDAQMAAVVKPEYRDQVSAVIIGRGGEDPTEATLEAFDTKGCLLAAGPVSEDALKTVMGDLYPAPSA